MPMDNMDLELEDADIQEAPETQQEGRYSDALNKTCQACRARKIRCQQNSNSSSARCARCEKKGIQCIFDAPNAKRRRKRTDVRVTALEKELHSLRSRLEGTGEAATSPSSLPPLNQSLTNPAEDSRMLSSTQKDPIVIASRTESSNTPAPDLHDDVSGMGFNLDKMTQQQLYSKFMRELSPHLPFIHFEASVTAQQLRQQQSILLDAILAASAGSLYAPLSQELVSRLEKDYAERIIVRGEKSIELVQALLVSAVWYQPPARYQDLKFTTFGHLAANMALDLRLASTRESAGQNMEFIENLNRKRVLIGCYLLCGSMALALHRPSMLQYTDWVEKYVELLRKSPIPSDHELVVWTDLMHIAENSASSLGLDERSHVELKDSRTQTRMKAFERQLTIWNEENWHLINSSLKTHFHYVRLQLHEIALHHDWDHAEFKPCYVMRPRPTKSSSLSEIGPFHLRSLIACVESAHGLLDVVLNLNVHTLRSAPVILFTRLFYAIVILSKMSLSAQSPASNLSKVIDLDHVNFLDYLFKIMSLLKAAAGDENISVPSTFYLIVTRLAAWYYRVCTSPTSQDPADEVLKPMAYLRTTDEDVHLDRQFSSSLVNPMLTTGIPVSGLHSTSIIPQLDFQMFHNFSEFDSYAFTDQFENNSLLSFSQHDFSAWNESYKNT